MLPIALGALLLIACGGAGGNGAAGVTPGSEREPQTPFLGCDPALEHATGSFPDETITTSDGRERTYVLHVPPSYNGAERMPLVLNFHGFGLSDDVYAAYTGLDAKADEAGFLLVTPQGLRTPTVDPPHWNVGPPSQTEPDDVAFVDELLDALEAELCVDPARVYAAGYSNGAGLSIRLACGLPDRIAAIAPVAGASFPQDVAACPAVPMIVFHGTGDALVPFDGRPGNGGLFIVRDIDDQVIPGWAEHNGCVSESEEDPLAGTAGVRLLRYDGCDEDATVELYAIEDADPATPGEQGGGHTWPGATRGEPDDPNNPTSYEISANDLIWEFFAAHPANR